MKITHVLSLLAFVAMVACSTAKHNMEGHMTLNQVYNRSIKLAMTGDSTNMIDTLQALVTSNPNLQWKTVHGQQYVLMATFTGYVKSFPPGDSVTTSWGETWLFIPAQMQYRLGRSFDAHSDTTLRISQMLGLPPVNSDKYIVQMWVPVSKLYRPAGSPNITTTTASPVLDTSATAAYKLWFNNYIIGSYYQPYVTHYPWTRMGYTYDWYPKGNRVGCSEFVLPKGSGIWVEKATTAAGFFK